MSRWLSLVLMIALVASLATPAMAQRPQGGERGRFGGFGGGMMGGRDGVMLLSQTSVQEDLKLSAEQVTQVNDAVAKQRASFEGFRELPREQRREKFEEAAKQGQAAVDAILSAEQKTRFRQIGLQIRGIMAFMDPEVVTALAVADDVKAEFDSLFQELQDDVRSAFEDAAGDREAIREEIENLRKEYLDRGLALLSDEQKNKWKELIGPEFTGKLDPPAFGGGRGGPGGRRGGGNGAPGA